MLIDNDIKFVDAVVHEVCASYIVEEIKYLLNINH